MPFHAGGHKPKAARQFRYPIKNRLQAAGAGAFCILGGAYQYLYGGFAGRNWLHQPVYSTSLLMLGIPVTLSALIPASWIQRAVKWIASRQERTGRR